MKPLIRADQLLGFIELMESAYEHDDGARAMAKSVRQYVNALAASEDYQRGVLLDEPEELVA